LKSRHDRVLIPALAASSNWVAFASLPTVHLQWQTN